MKNSFVNPKGLNARANKLIFIFICSIFVENCLHYDMIHDFSVWLRTCFNPADNNRFRTIPADDFCMKIKQQQNLY